MKKRILIVLLLLICSLSVQAQAGTDRTFSVTMLDVGQGLSLLVEADGHYMLYDGGGRKASSYVVSYLKKRGIENLEYIVVSHYDEDHISGLAGVLKQFEVETAITPDYEADTDIYQIFRKYLYNSSAEEIHPLLGQEFDLGQATIKIIGPRYHYNDGNENNESIIVRITYGQNACIISGDAEADAEEDLVNEKSEDLPADLYVAGHHGSSSSSSKSFVKAISPDYVFISAGKDNAYGHPTEKTLETLRNNGVEIYRTDLQGEVTAFSDGDSIWVDAEPVTEAGPGKQKQEPKVGELEQPEMQTEERESVEASPDMETEYIVNENTKKFHYPDCRSVKQMKEKNKTYSTLTREELINQGYDPCQNCNP